MMMRRCKMCGAVFEGGKEQRLCPACRRESRDTVLRDRTCRSCGATFPGGPRAWYCPVCRGKRRAESDRRRRKLGAARPLGSIAQCEVCGKDYVVKSGRQRYCPECAPETIRDNANARTAQNTSAHREEISARKRELREGSNICKVCGEVLPDGGMSVTCSVECADILRRYRNAEADYRRGKRKTQIPKERKINVFMKKFSLLA